MPLKYDLRLPSYWPMEPDKPQNLTAFVCAVFNKKYPNPNTDIIEILAGLDAIDGAMSDLVSTLDSLVRQSAQESLRAKAVATVLAIVSGGFQTSLVTYFMHRDLFPALTKVNIFGLSKNSAHRIPSSFTTHMAALCR
jgi:hypothetical protein